MGSPSLSVVWPLSGAGAAPGARVVVDTTRRLPVIGEFFVLRDGDGPAVKRIELAPGERLAKLRLHCANPG